MNFSLRFLLLVVSLIAVLCAMVIAPASTAFLYTTVLLQIAMTSVLFVFAIATTNHRRYFAVGAIVPMLLIAFSNINILSNLQFVNDIFPIATNAPSPTTWVSPIGPGTVNLDPDFGQPISEKNAAAQADEDSSATNSYWTTPTENKPNSIVRETGSGTLTSTGSITKTGSGSISLTNFTAQFELPQTPVRNIQRFTSIGMGFSFLIGMLCSFVYGFISRDKQVTHHVSGQGAEVKA